MTKFKELGLNSKLIESLQELGFDQPTPIQQQAIPFVLSSTKDLIALAQTGTGKTAAFSLPILNQIDSDGRNLQAIIICPTRELCLQITQDIKRFTKHSKGIATMAVYGGESISGQIKDLKRGTNIVVGTPGRLHDLIRRKVLKLQDIRWVVLDEADEMLDMGFKDDLDNILAQTPKQRQTLLFSATMSKSVHTIAKKYMSDATEISVGDKNSGAKNVSHEYYVVKAGDRFEALKRIIDSIPDVYGILFCRTRNETQTVADKLKRAGYDTEAIHGEITQSLRTKIMERFKQKKVRLLVATNVAARGIDVSNLSHVINYNLPDQNEAYTHRTGRTGRASQSGVAITIITPREVRLIRQIEDIVGKTIEYKKVPQGADVYQRQIDSFIERVQNSDINSVQDKHLDDIVDKLKKIKKEDLIKHFVADKFSELIKEYKTSNSDLNATVSKEAFATASRGKKNRIVNTANLKINFGRKDGFDIKSLFSLFNSNKTLQEVEIGRIDLMDEYSVFGIEANNLDLVKKTLESSEFKGRKIEISMTEAVAKEARYSSGRPRSGFKKGGFNKRGGSKKRGSYRRSR